MTTTATASGATAFARRPFWLATVSAAAITVAAFVTLDAGLLPQLGRDRAEVTTSETSTASHEALTKASPEALTKASPEALVMSDEAASAPPAADPARIGTQAQDAGQPMVLDMIAPRAPSPTPPNVSAETGDDIFNGFTGGAVRSAPSRLREASPPTMQAGRVARDLAVREAPRPVLEVPSTERHPDADPSGTLLVVDAPVSTFSVDVDTASYAFVRDVLMEGRLPHPDAVRPEEMLNYFAYDLPAPDGDAPFSVATGVVDTPWNEATRLLAIGIEGMVPPADTMAPRNLVFLVDISGSMGDPDKLPLLKRSFRLLLTQLRPEDEVAIVTYAGSAGTVLEPTRAANASAILDALDALTPGGSTAGRDGLARAYAVADAMSDEGEAARIVLATDGDFNVGPASDDELERFVARNRSTASLSVIGFGRGNTDDRLMQAIAQNGDGFAAHIDTDAEARRVMVERVAGTLDTIARDVKVQVEFNPAAVSEYRLIGYETRALTRRDFNDDRVDAGEIGAGHRTVALYEVTPAGAGLVDPLRYGDDAATEPGDADEFAFLRLRYKAPVATGADESVLIERAVAPDAGDFPASEVRFAAAVAAFADTLRGTAAVSGFGFDDIEALAAENIGDDPTGERREFLDLVRLAGLAR